MNILAPVIMIHPVTSYLLPLWLVLLSLSTATGQLPRLMNSSFEGEPRDATIPRGWYKCTEGTTPDILPGPWGVYQEPVDGSSYLGLITRENGTWESIGQKISDVLKAGDCYYLTVQLARSDTYMGYDKAVKMRIWGGAGKCGRDQLLVETDFIEHTEWREYIFEFTPDEDIRYIIIEAYYTDPPFEHPGNLLIDDLSHIRPCGRT